MKYRTNEIPVEEALPFKFWFEFHKGDSSWRVVL